MINNLERTGSRAQNKRVTNTFVIRLLCVDIARDHLCPWSPRRVTNTSAPSHIQDDDMSACAVHRTTSHSPQPFNMSGADDDACLIALWLDGKAENTKSNYRLDVEAFFAFTEGSIRATSLDDLVAFKSRLQTQGYAPSSIARRLAALKSLFTFAHKTGYLPYNVGAPLTPPPTPSFTLKKTLTRGEIAMMERAIYHASCPSVRDRNVLIIRTFYGLGLRASELVNLTWDDLREGQCIVENSKGGKTRTLHVHPTLWNELMAFRPERALPHHHVFRSTRASNGAWRLSRVQITRIVKKAAEAAGLDVAQAVSSGWLRHSHATHAIEVGAPLHELQAALGHASLATTGVYLHARQDRSTSDSLRCERFSLSCCF